MKFRHYRLQNTAESTASGGTAATLMTDGANTTPAATSSASTATADATAQAAATTTAAAGANQQPSTEEGATKTAPTEAEAAEAAAKAAPEKYEFKAPDGVTLDAELLGEFEGMAKELKLSQGDAQKVADLGVKLTQKFATQQAQAVETASAEWAATSTADKEFGGDKLTASLVSAEKALSAFGTPELKALLKDSRLGNHPEVIRFMVRAGKAISEDRMVTGGAGPATASTTTAKALYPNQS
jgi:hypothetical protein